MASGGHFNPAVTAAFIVIRRIDPIDGLVYILAQLSGGVLGALLTKAFLLDEGRASDYGTPKISAAAGRRLPGFLVEGIGAFVLVLTVSPVALNPETRRWAALAIGGALGLGVSWSSVRSPAARSTRRAGSAPLSWATTSPTPGPTSSARSSVVCSRRPSTGSSSSPRSGPVQEMADTVAPRGPAPPAGESPPLRQERPGGPPPSSPGGIAGASVQRPLAVGARAKPRCEGARSGATHLVMCGAAACGRDLMPKGSVSLG